MSEIKIARVFPRRTRATPRDELSFTEPPGLFPPEVDAVHVSVVFTWDIPRAEWLAREWERVAPVSIGGPAMGTRGEDFVPGRYLAPGYVITSRGCPNRCWFCSVWKRDGKTRELKIEDGCNILDDNLLACSDSHIKCVLKMLELHRGHIQFTGGLDSTLLQDWHIELLWRLRPRQMFFAYDTPDDLAPLQNAGKRLLARGWTRAAKRLRCYVLLGYPGDTFDAAEKRLSETIEAGFLPMAMLWRSPHDGKAPLDWRRFQRRWARPTIMGANRISML